MRFQKVACGLLLVTLATPATVVRAAGDETHTNAPAAAGGIRASIERAAESVARRPTASLPTTRTVGFSTSGAATVPLSLPRQRRLNKGMGAGMMVMSLVGTAAGIAGTYYMIKTLKDQTKTVPGS